MDLRATITLLYSLPAAAVYFSNLGHPVQGVELYSLAKRYSFVANSRWFEDVAGRQINAIAETLPPEVAAAARERGRSWDLWATVEELLAELGGPPSL